jgi:uncharacterized protein YcnI
VRPPVRSWSLAGLLALVATAVVAVPASAHPFVRGGEAPVDSVATVELAMAHGCGTETAGGGDPTLEIALEVPDEVRIVAVADDPTYDHEVELDDDGRVTVVTWTATDGGEPAPDVVFDVVFSGEVGDEVYLPVFQGCEGFAYRWIGTPDEPAEDPAVRVTLTDADPDAPPPAPDEPTEAEQAAAPEDEPADEPEGPDDTTDATDGDAAEDGDPADDAVEPAADPEETEELAGEVEEADAEGGFPVWLVIVIAVLLGLGGALALQRRGSGRPDDEPTS